MQDKTWPLRLQVLKPYVVCCGVAFFFAIIFASGLYADTATWEVRKNRLTKIELTYEINSITAATDMATNTSLLQPSRSIEIYYEPEHQAWGEMVQKYLKQPLAYMIDRFGPPITTTTLRIVEDPQLTTRTLYTPSAIYIHPKANWLDIAHTMLYLWFENAFSDQFLQYGILQWEAFLALKSTTLSNEAIHAWKTFLYYDVPAWVHFDLPLKDVAQVDQKPAQHLFLETKATAWAVLYYMALGEKRYDAWIRGVPNSMQKQTFDDALVQIKESGQNPQDYQAGWLTQQEYGRLDWLVFRDLDRDFLPTAFELFLGTDPHRPDTNQNAISDGYEYWYGNPSNPQKKLQKKAQNYPAIVVDGLLEDWYQKQLKPAYKDPVGDARIIDIKQIWLNNDRDALYVAIEPTQSLEENIAYQAVIYFDFNQDEKVDLVVFGNQATQTWYSRVYHPLDAPVITEIHQTVELEIHHAQVIELKLPRQLFEEREQIRLNVRIETPDGTTDLDHTGGYWHRYTFH